jgi:prepilin peptidase CpaA
MEHLTQTLGLCAWAACAAWADWQHRRLPNVLTLGGLAFALVSLLWLGRSWNGGEATSAWAGFGVAFALTVPGYLLSKLGAGDVKLLMAMGLLTDLPTLLLTFVIGSVVGLALGLWPLARRWAQDTLSVTLGQAGWMSTQAHAKGRHIPYGTALAVGFVLALASAMEKF